MCLPDFTRRTRKYGLMIALLIVVFSIDAVAQVYRATLNQRRRGDQIFVEVWIKSLQTTAPKLGEASLVIQYNPSFLTPATTQSPSTTDTVNYDVDILNPVQTVNAAFDGASGYQAVAAMSYGSGLYSIEVRKVFGSSAGIVPSADGRGSFVGKMVFDITTAGLTDATLSQVMWNNATMPGDVVVYDFSDNDIESQVSFVNPGAFTVRGITVLNPNGPSEVVDRNKTYASVVGGYPIYFERSGLPYTTYGINEAAYSFDVSLNGGSSWSEFARASEDGTTVTGEITATGVRTSGGAVPAITGRTILRAVWASSLTFSSRSEQARIRITSLTDNSGGALTGRVRETRFDISDDNFVLGRLFFAQLNGTNQYFKTSSVYSNATQLTVGAWVNLNSITTGSDVGIVATSGGPTSGTEGAWMLYLKDGQYPAFRAREILDRGTNGYIANIVSNYPLTSTSDAIPLSAAHGQNWVHIAATVANNTVRLYVNGELIEEKVNNLATNIRMQTTSHPIWVGVNPNISIEAADHLHAGLKGVQIWRTALTQDQIRTRVSGVITPALFGIGPSDPLNINLGLEMYYTLEGSRADGANHVAAQAGDQVLSYNNNGVVANSLTRFRPDQPHIRLTSPSGLDGASNLPGTTGDFNIRWVAYGVGDFTAPGSDLAVEFSTDGGTSWTYARNDGGDVAANDLGPGAAAAVDVEAGTTIWRPYNNEGTVSNAGAGANLRSIASSFSKPVVLRIRGLSAGESDVQWTSNEFKVAPYFALKNFAGTKITVPSTQTGNVTGTTFALESWIRPYRFPTVAEGAFTIIAKYDTATGKAHYKLSLLPTGQLELKVTTATGDVRTAVSSSTSPLVRPNIISLDSTWSHVAVWVNLGNGTGSSEVRFYIDGTVQRVDSITTQLGSGITLNKVNSNPIYMGYCPVSSSNTESFIGEIRDLRFWNGTPANASSTGLEPTALTTHIQGALNVLGSTLTGAADDNLTLVFGLNGGPVNPSGYNSAIVSSIPSATPLRAEVLGTPISYEPVQPVLKLVEPTFNQRVRNATTDLLVRWVGFNFDGSATGFAAGTGGGSPIAPSLEFSVRGGGGVIIQPYQRVGSVFWDAAQTNSITLSAPLNFTGAGGNMRFGLRLNMNLADPDLDNNGTYDDQAPMSATLSNARLRLSNTYTINAVATTISSEGPLFTVTPPSNLTVRMLLEGYHDGLNGTSFSNLGTTFAGGGVRVKLYSDNAGTPGSLVASSESEFQYDANAFTVSAIANIGTNTGDGPRFATVPFVLTDLPDGSYWVVVEHPNHLPVMSRVPVTFQYSGDDLATVVIESGIDFSSWNGTDDHASFSAFGLAKSITGGVGYSNTGLNYNEGRDGTTGVSANYIASLVAGDCNRDGQINASDRVIVRQDASTSAIRSDVTGDGAVNAADRTLVDRNFGKVSSISGVSFPAGLARPIDGTNNPFTFISALNPELSARFIANAKQKSNIPVMLKKATTVQGAMSYVVTAEPTRVGNTVEVPVFVQNTGSAFNLGNATFSVEFNPTKVSYLGMSGTDGVIFNNKQSRGYNLMYSAPRNEADYVVPNVRTLEIDYDAYSNRGGETVPNTKTFIGTLRFQLLENTNSVGFKWFRTSQVFDANGLSTTGGEFRPIGGLLLYSAAITSPVVGERVGAGRNLNVTWTATANAQVFVEISTNNGQTWTRTSDKSVSSLDLKLTSLAPETVAQDCFVRLVDVETGLELSRSKKFAIVNIAGSISRPSANDPIYIGGASDLVRWLSQGISNVRFEFSENGGSTWTSISSVRRAADQTTTWRVPSVNTRRAVVRMIDEETQEEMTRTSPFKVLAGSLSFLNPVGGETMREGQTTRLRWRILNNVDLVDLQYSTDGGSSWSLLRAGVSARTSSLDWTIPAINSTKVIVRAIYPNEPELEYSRTPEFRVSSTTSVTTGNSIADVSILIQPNPVAEVANALITMPTASNVRLEITNALGQVVARIEKVEQLQAGESMIALPVMNLQTGTYYLQLTAGTYRSTTSFVVVR